MDPKKIARINELARKKKESGLTAEETAEQAELRREYLVIQEPDGTKHRLQKKDR